MNSDDHLLPISALQHLIFCERQCALIHVERLWVENRLTVEGRQLHDRAHEGADEYRANVTVARGMPLRSSELGLYGVADVVELHHGNDHARAESPALKKPAPKKPTPNPVTPAGAEDMTTLPLSKHYSRVLPVEYKRGKPKKDDSDRVQLCAQAMCLEEMFQCDVPVGYLFYGKRKRRTEVALDDALRNRTRSATDRLHQMIANRETPRARREPKCDSCSLVELCLPAGTGPDANVASKFQKQLAATLGNERGPAVDAEFDVF